MTPQEFDQSLQALGWKGSDFARRAGTVDNTVWRWRKGHVAIPEWVGQYLGALLAIQDLHARFVAVRRPGQAPALESDRAHARASHSGGSEA